MSETNPTEDESTESTDELSILEPDIELVIGDESIMVREFGFLEGMDAARIAGPLIKDMAIAMSGGKAEEVEFSTLEAVFAKHKDAFLQLLSISCDKSVDWLKDPDNLNDKDGYNLTMTFWTVNADFFMRRLMMSVTQQEVDAPSDSEKSTQH